MMCQICLKTFWFSKLFWKTMTFLWKCIFKKKLHFLQHFNPILCQSHQPQLGSILEFLNPTFIKSPLPPPPQFLDFWKKIRPSATIKTPRHATPFNIEGVKKLRKKSAGEGQKSLILEGECCYRGSIFP